MSVQSDITQNVKIDNIRQLMESCRIKIHGRDNFELILIADECVCC